MPKEYPFEFLGINLVPRLGCVHRKFLKGECSRYTAMAVEALAVRRCLLATEYRFLVQSLQRLRSRYGM